MKAELTSYERLTDTFSIMTVRTENQRYTVVIQTDMTGLVLAYYFDGKHPYQSDTKKALEFEEWLEKTAKSQTPVVSHNLLGAVYRVKVDQGGRVVIPKDIRDELEIDEGDTIEYRTTRTGAMMLNKVKSEPYWVIRTMRAADGTDTKVAECTNCHNLSSLNNEGRCPHCGVKIDNIRTVM